MPKWIKIYLTKEQYDEWRSGNGLAIGYSEEQVREMQMLEKRGIDCGLSYDKLDHMTKVNPRLVSSIGWSDNGYYLSNKPQAFI